MVKNEKKKGKSIVPLADGVLVLPVESDATKTPSGIIIPDTAQKKESKEGTVIAVGPGKLNDEGKLMPMPVKVGDVVVFRQGWDNEIEIDEVKHYIVGLVDIKAIIK